jgi:hypothetical protein
MPVAREGRFLVFRDQPPAPHLGLETDILSLCIEECRSHPYKAVFGTPSFGFRESDLECLRELPHLEAVWFWDVALNNIDALYALTKLEFFGVHPKRPAIDFCRLPTLKSLVWIYKPQDKGVGALRSLDHLSLWHFKPKSKSFADLQVPSQVSELNIMWANPSTLEGLTPNTSIRRLEISRCRNLESLALLPELFPSLEHLVVVACGRISHAEGARVAAQLPSLKHAYVGDKLVL